MSDKTLIQQDLADKLTKILFKLKPNVAISYLGALWKILAREWYQIDRLRYKQFHVDWTNIICC
jgi:hypothetical protein